MRHPITDLAGNLMWTTSGTCWATWRIQPLPYGLRPLKDKQSVKDLHRMLFRSFSGEALLQGVEVSVDPTVVVERQLSGVDLEACPAWVAEARANLDRLSDPDLVLGQRVYYLSVPLANSGKHQFTAPLVAATGRLKEQLALPRQHPRAQEVQFRNLQAQRVADAFPTPFHATAITVAEQIWLSAHHQMRGMLDVPPDIATEFGSLVTSSGVVLPSPVLDPGAQSDLDTKRSGINPLGRRVLKVINPDRPAEASYQALMVLASTPQGGVTFPGGELLGFLDDLGPETDWAIRMKVNSRDKVMHANRKAVRDLNDQYDQRGDGNSGGSQDLDLASSLLHEYQDLFASDRLEVEVEHEIVLATGADTFEGANGNAEHIQRTLGGMDFKFDRPIGAEEQLWWSMQAGVPTSSTVRAYAQFTTSDQFARLVPITTTKLGGQKGAIFALNTATARADVVHLDPGGYPELDKSGSVAFSGELGAGKTYGLKTMAGHIVAQGGQLFTIDKSAEGEWAVFARALTDDAVVVDPSDPKWSMDPLRCLPDLDEGAIVAQSFLSTLIGCSPRDQDGRTLGLVLQPDYLTRHALRSLHDVVTHLRADSGLTAGPDLSQQISVYADTVLGRLVFDPELPAIKPTSAAVVWRTHRMAQPTEAEMATEHLFRSLSLEKVFGRAYYRLLMAVARRWAFADRTRVSALLLDEAYDAFVNPENVLEGEHFVRQGRRPRALMLLGSHNPEGDFGSDTLRRLIPTRVAMRHTDPDLAAASVRWLGIDEKDPAFKDMVETLVTDTSPALPDIGVPEDRRGECFIRDAFGGIGSAKVLGPAQPDLAAAVTSTPPKIRAGGSL